ncbi:hypothetical protein [Paraburkholderia sediminicola]|uniref:hypothetical protein n=1 Tax=Paraburkholderia sediminicola TaxID=458836 RepID=UPI0038B77742
MGLLNKKGFFAWKTTLLLRHTPFPGKALSKMALSSANDRSRKNPEFPYAENYAQCVDIRNELPVIFEQSDFYFLGNAGYY